MHRSLSRTVALLLVALLTLTACTTDGTTGGRGEPVAGPPAPAASPESPVPPAEPALEPTPDTTVLQLDPGLTDATTFPGEPLLLALGDSIAAGTGLTALRDGFVWRVHRAIAEERGTPYGLDNRAEPGATSTSLLTGGQLAAAEEALATGSVDTVLISVGGNDLLRLFTGACAGGVGSEACATAVDDAVASYEEALATILDRLVAAGPDARLVVLQTYNPFDLGLGLRVERVSTQAAVALNEAAARAAARHGARVADGYTTLAGRITATTGMGDSRPDVHPTPLGHDLLALAILEALAS